MLVLGGPFLFQVIGNLCTNTYFFGGGGNDELKYMFRKGRKLV